MLSKIITINLQRNFYSNNYLIHSKINSAVACVFTSDKRVVINNYKIATKNLQNFSFEEI